ncbi:MAG: ABC transporter permease subunit [Erysipelotrichaceae bacterium]|nr:ABC transporter permease subunit [Erysipelotrichaceae bacterium]
MKTSTTKNNILKYGLAVSSVILLFVIWSIIALVKKDTDFFPGFDLIFQEIGFIFSNLETLRHFSLSFLRIILVVISSLGISIIISLLYVWCRQSIYFFKPLLVLMKATPLAIISLYILISLGDEKAPYLITLLVTLPVTIEGFIAAIDNINPNIKLELKVTTANFGVKFFRVYLPMILPYIGMTLLQTFGLGIKVMVMAEYLCATKTGIGRYIQNAKNNFEYDKLLATLIIIVLIVSMIEFIIKYVTKKLSSPKTESEIE